MTFLELAIDINPLKFNIVTYFIAYLDTKHKRKNEPVKLINNFILFLPLLKGLLLSELIYRYVVQVEVSKRQANAVYQ
jgi:hypothetical protein